MESKEIMKIEANEGCWTTADIAEASGKTTATIGGWISKAINKNILLIADSIDKETLLINSIKEKQQNSSSKHPAKYTEDEVKFIIMTGSPSNSKMILKNLDLKKQLNESTSQSINTLPVDSRRIDRLESSLIQIAEFVKIFAEANQNRIEHKPSFLSGKEYFTFLLGQVAHLYCYDLQDARSMAYSYYGRFHHINLNHVAKSSNCSIIEWFEQNNLIEELNESTKQLILDRELTLSRNKLMVRDGKIVHKRERVQSAGYEKI